VEIWVRGKMLGGSSAVNGMVWNRGPPGVGGPISVKSHPAPSPLAKAWIAAGAELGLPVKTDHSGPAREGIGPLQWNIDRRGRRVSAARDLLDRAKGRPNLTIATGARIDRVTIEQGRAVGVSGVLAGEPIAFAAAREVILSAGSLVSPRILQLSGIGPGDVLKAAGVPIVLESPDVGRHMREHILLALNFRLRRWADSDNRSFSGARLLQNLARHVVLRSGTLSYGSSEAAAFVRVLEESARPDTQIMFQPYSMARGAGGFAFEKHPGFSLYSFRLRPESEGSVSIGSPDPAAPLIIDPRYLTVESDRRAVVGAVRYMRKLAAQSALADFVSGETEATASAQSAEDILAAYSRWGAAEFHATATVAWGRPGGDHDALGRIGQVHRAAFALA